MSVSSERIQISKRLRFRVFDRDNFTCRYCGKSPPSVKLVVDHVIPIAEGGTNDDDNLIASCEECNQGKGPKRLQTAGPAAEHDSAKMAQEWIEQKDMAQLAADAARARLAVRQEVVNYFCELTGLNGMGRRYVSTIVNLCYEFSFDEVMEWMDSAMRNIDLAATSIMYEHVFIKYVCGCARHRRSVRG